MKEATKLIVDQNGILKDSGVKVTSVESFTQLNDFSNIEIMNNEIIIQPLPDKEMTTSSGIVLPGKKGEFLAIVALTKEDSPYKRGQVVALNPMYFQEGVFREFIDGKECTICDVNAIRYRYKNYDLSGWTLETK